MTLKPPLMLLEVVFCRFPDSLRLAESRLARGDFRIKELNGFSVRQPALPGRDRARRGSLAFGDRLQDPFAAAAHHIPSLPRKRAKSKAIPNSTGLGSLNNDNVR